MSEAEEADPREAETEVQTHGEAPAASTPRLRSEDDESGGYETDPFAPTEVDIDTPRPSGRRPRPKVPAEIAGYRIERELARGGMGVVYEAIDPALDRAVALKVVRDPLRAGEDELDRFAIEAKAAAGLRHPGIVAVHAYGETADGLPYLVMDLIEGESLAARLRRDGAIPPREAARFMRVVADALATAHAAGVLHRDLKPANVLVDREGTPYLTDFGLAKRVEATEDQVTFTGQVLGTPSYMAPEQAEGDGRIDVRSDVYGLGATLYHLLTGRPPYEGGNPWQVLSAVLLEAPPTPRDHVPALDLSIEAICLRCMERAPARRYPNAAAVAADLGRYLANEPVEARPLTPWRRVGRSVRRQGARIALGLFVFSMVLGAGLLAEQARREKAPFNHLDQARSLLRLDRAPVEIEAEVDAALRLGADRERVKLEAARVLGEAGFLGRARTLLEQAVRDHPPGVEALLELHRLEVGGGPTRFTPALARLAEAARAAGRDDAYARFARGAELLETEPARAVEAFEAALTGAPRFAWARLGLATALDRLGQPQRALAAVDRALAIDARLSSAHFLRGRLHAEAGRLEEARRDLAEAERLAPSHGWAPYRLGLLEVRAEQLEAAEVALTRASDRFEAVANAQGQAMALGARAVVRKELGRGPEAQADAAQAIERWSGAAKAHWVLAELASEANDEGEARRQLDLALKADPNLVPALILRGQLRSDLADLDRAVHLAPRSVEALRARAHQYAQIRQLKQARVDLNAALALDPGDAKAYDMRADVAQLSSDWVAAERDYGNAITAQGDWPDPWIKRGILRAKLGRPEEAKTDWEAALKHMPATHPRRSSVEAWLAKVR